MMNGISFGFQNRCNMLTINVILLSFQYCIIINADF